MIHLKDKVSWFRRFLCKLFGHRAICLWRHNNLDIIKDYNYMGSETTGWKCLCCKGTWYEQWDN